MRYFVFWDLPPTNHENTFTTKISRFPVLVFSTINFHTCVHTIIPSCQYPQRSVHHRQSPQGVVVAVELKEVLHVTCVDLCESVAADVESCQLG